jgi:hypothetical protein
MGCSCCMFFGCNLYIIACNRHSLLPLLPDMEAYRTVKELCCRHIRHLLFYTVHSKPQQQFVHNRHLDAATADTPVHPR